MKSPPYGKFVAERLKFGNLPFFVVVCIGMDAWTRAKAWNSGTDDTPAMVWPPETPPEALRWPVSRCRVIVDWDVGPSDEQVIALIRALIRAGAALVCTKPLFTDYDKPLQVYDIENKTWKQVQEIPRFYRGRAHAC